MKNDVMVKAFIFDMDGVLLDTESLCKKCWRLAAVDWELSDVDSVYYACVGQARQDTFRTLNDFIKKQKKLYTGEDFYFHAVEYFKKEEAEKGIPKMKGVDDCLNRLSQKGYILALASSTRREVVERQLTTAGIIHYFKTITCGDSVKHSKPDPEIYINACASLELRPEECAAVEDSPNGIRSAFDAGMKVFMVPDQIKPDEEIKSKCTGIICSLDELSPD